MDLIGWNSLPQVKAIDYVIQFSATTFSKGRLKLSVDADEKITLTDDKIRAWKGLKPINGSQGILYMRDTFKADERTMD